MKHYCHCSAYSNCNACSLRRARWRVVT